MGQEALVQMTIGSRHGSRYAGSRQGGQDGVHHDPHAERECAFVEVEGGSMDVVLVVLARPDAEAAH